MARRFQTVSDARLALWKRMLGEYRKLVNEGVLPHDLCDDDGDSASDERLLLIAMETVELQLKKHALER